MGLLLAPPGNHSRHQNEKGEKKKEAANELRPSENTRLINCCFPLCYYQKAPFEPYGTRRQSRKATLATAPPDLPLSCGREGSPDTY